MFPVGTVEAFAKGQIKLPEVELKNPVANQVKIAPSFISFSVVVRPSERRDSDSDKTPLYYTNHTLAEFLGWVTDNDNPQDRLTDAVAALAFIEQDPHTRAEPPRVLNADSAAEE